MAIPATLLAILIPIFIVVFIILAFIIAKKLIKIVLWLAIVILLVGTVFSIYNDVINFDSRNTLFFYENDGDIKSAFIGKPGVRETVPNFDELKASYLADSSALYGDHHKIVHIKLGAFDTINELVVRGEKLSRAEMIDGLNSGDALTFLRAYDASRKVSWFLKGIKSENIVVEPDSIAFRIAQWIP